MDLGAGRLVAGLPFCLLSMVSTSVCSIWRGKGEIKRKLRRHICRSHTPARLPLTSAQVQEQRTHGKDSIQLQEASLGTFAMKLVKRCPTREQAGTSPSPPKSISLLSCSPKGRTPPHTLEPLPSTPAHLVIVSAEVFEVPEADVTQADHNGDHEDHKGEHGSGSQEP